MTASDGSSGLSFPGRRGAGEPPGGPTPPSSRSGLDRRGFLRGGLAVGAGAGASTLLGPGWVRPAFALVRSGRPHVTHGVQSGDVTAGSAVVWARSDRPARLVVEIGTDERFKGARTVWGPVTGPDEDFTARAELSGLPDDEELFYRAFFAGAADRDILGEPVTGRFHTAPGRRRDVTFCWSGDTAGQGWGINPEFGGMRAYETMRRLGPDFFLHSGDNIYADGPISATVALPGGGEWHNVVTPEKSKVAETLDEFRGNYRYNLLDANVLRFNAEVPIINQWDDHETVNNWYPGEILDDPRYRVKEVDVLAARSKQAFHEYMPFVARGPGDIYRKVSYGPSLDVFVLDLRSYRGPNTSNDQAQPGEISAILGRRQLQWLTQELRASSATWKAIASDLPVGLVVPDGRAFEGIAQGRPEALGRELEISDLLSSIKRHRVRNVVWFTADVHYTAAHHYDPSRASFTDFDPFWEFVSGPLNAGTFGPNPLDATFGPEVRFQRAADRPNQPPSDGLQFVGHVGISGDSRVMTVRLLDLAGEELYRVDLDPEGEHDD